MNKMELIAVAEGKTELTIVSVTSPKLNKFARTLRDENGKKVPCPFAGIQKVTQFTFDLVRKYVPVQKAEGTDGAEVKERKPFYQATEFNWLKQSIADENKYYISGYITHCESFYIKDNVIVSKDELTEYLPPARPATDGELWLTLGIEGIEVVDK